MKCLKVRCFADAETFGAPKIQELAMNLSSINLFLKWDWVLVSVENACSLHYRKNRFSLQITRPKSAKRRKMGFDKIKPFKPTFQLLDWLSFLKKHMKKNVIVLALLNSVFFIFKRKKS